jgi:hypothetical protein
MLRASIPHLVFVGQREVRKRQILKILKSALGNYALVPIFAVLFAE